MRTTIKKTDTNEVTLTAIDNLTDEPIKWVFWISRNGGYVRIGETHSANDPQVCERLGFGGRTLWAKDGDDLLAIIRHEWASRRRASA